VSGWIGCFARNKGGQKFAGIAIFQNDRCIMGGPDSWRPSKLFGNARGGTVNQRLVGEINLDDPNIEVSHTKDQVLWQGDQEDSIADFLHEIAVETDILRMAKKQSYSDVDSDGAKRDLGLAEFEDWASDPLMTESIEFSPIPPAEVTHEADRYVLDHTGDIEPDLVVNLPALGQRIMIKIVALSPNDPYYSYEITDGGDLVSVINSSHVGYLTAAATENPLFTYFVQCALDSFAEWKCHFNHQEVNPSSVKAIKDDLLRAKPDAG